MDDFYIPPCDDTYPNVNADDLSWGGPGRNLQYVGESSGGCGALVFPGCLYDCGGVSIPSPDVLQTNITNAGFGGSVTVVLSNEYTTAQLEADVRSDISGASWGAWSGAGYNTTIFDQTVNQKTITMREVEVRMTLPVLTPGQCYRLTWNIYDSYLGIFFGGSYTWNGVDTEVIVAVGLPGIANFYRDFQDLVAYCSGC